MCGHATSGEHHVITGCGHMIGERHVITLEVDHVLSMKLQSIRPFHHLSEQK